MDGQGAVGLAWLPGKLLGVGVSGRLWCPAPLGWSLGSPQAGEVGGQGTPSPSQGAHWAAVNGVGGAPSTTWSHLLLPVQ